MSISESTENGKITLTVDGVKTTVPIHGLGSAAYTNSNAYSPADHTHTKAQIGLGSVDNTADKDKSVKHANTADSATTAGTATTATNVSAEIGQADIARHVWFSDSATETKRNYNDKFKYNPTTNTVTANISGSAASANSVLWSGVTNKPSTFTPSAHNHDDSTITSLNASKLFGIIDIARLPHGALERLVIVEDDTARFKLTTANVQLGDTVKVIKTEKMYYVVDESKLSSEAGYSVYTAGTATSVPWSGVTGKPTSYPPASHNHDERYYTETEMNSKLAEKAPKVHTHVKSEVGLGNVDNTADANKSVKYATSAGSSTTSGAISSSGTLDTVAKLDAFIEDGKVKYATVSALDGLNGMIKNDGICISTPWTSTGYGHQFYINDNGYDLYHRFRNTTKVNNVDTTTWSSWKQILDSSNYNIYAPTKTGSGASGTWGISVTGNAATATKLATARSINGTNFDGTGNITTATWGTARNVTIGNTKKSVNGSADVSWSLSEIGAAAASHSHSYLPLSGGTMTGDISYKGSKATYEMIRFIDNPNDEYGNGIAIGGGGLTIVGGGESANAIKLTYATGGDEHLILANDGPIDIYTNCQDGLNKATHVTIDNSGLYSGTAAKANSVPWSGVTGKPSTYTPSSHTHKMTDIPDWGSYIYDVHVSRTANTVLAAPNGSNGSATFRKLVAADIPSITKSKISDFPSSLPASDVYAWAKASTKPSYTKAEVGLGNVDNTADSAKSVKYATSAGNANSSNYLKIVANNEIRFVKPSSALSLYIGYAWSDGTKSKMINEYKFYGGDGNLTQVTASQFNGSLSGNASSATALTTSAGSATQPVYFSGGKPVACSYTLGKSVPSNAVFTDTNTWRGIQNNLTSDSTSDSLSAAQGKALKALVDGKAASSHSHNKVSGAYTGNGGQQKPNYFGTNQVGFLMMNTAVNNNTHYKDWIIMDCYSGTDVGGAVAFGVNRQSLGAYIMRSESGRTSWSESAELLHTANYNSYAPTKTGGGASGTWGINVTGSSTSCSGNAGSATKLQTARTINGTSFNGSANITTANWGTARTITVGNTGKSVNGSGNVSWSLGEIGIHVSNKEPAASEGKNGDVWIVYEG